MAAELTEVVRALAPTLRGWGFRRFGQTFNRERETGLFHVIGFQGSRWNDGFTVNVGIYLREVDQLFDDHWTRYGPGLGTKKVLREELCWLRTRIGRLEPTADDRWWPYTELDAAIQDVAARLQTHVAPTLDSSATRAALIAWWDSPPPRSPQWRLESRTPLGFALLLRDAGRVEEARAIVHRVWQHARRPFRGTVELHAERLGMPMV